MIDQELLDIACKFLLLTKGIRFAPSLLKVSFVLTLLVLSKNFDSVFKNSLVKNLCRQLSDLQAKRNFTFIVEHFKKRFFMLLIVVWPNYGSDESESVSFKHLLIQFVVVDVND